MTLTEAQINEVTDRLRERGAGEDNIQDTLLKLCAQSDPPRDIVAWACTVSLRMDIDHKRTTTKHLYYVKACAGHPAYHDPRTVDHLPPDRVYDLGEQLNKWSDRLWKDAIHCEHPDQPRYGNLGCCKLCYLRAYRQARK